MLDPRSMSPRGAANRNMSFNDEETPYTSMEATLPSSSDEENGEESNTTELKADNNDLNDYVGSVLTADGIHDVPGFFVVCVVTFVGDMARGIMFPSLWPLVKNMGGTHVTLGYAVAAFSFGRILVNPLFGSWSITYGYTKTLLWSLTILLLGSFMYTQVQNVGRPEFLVVSQTVIGIGTGTLGVTRAFVADVTAKRSRTMYIGRVAAIQYAGFTISPLIGAIFNRSLEDVDREVGLLRINMYTAPAFTLASFVLFTILLIHIFFQDRNRIEITKDKRNKKKSQRRTEIERTAGRIVCCNWTVYDLCILGCMLLAIAPEGTIASFETLGIAFAESHFDMSSSHAAFVVSACGSLGVISLLSIGQLSKLAGDIGLICGGMLNMILGMISLTGLDENSNAPTWRYTIGIFMIYSVGFPVAHTAVIGLFSKIVGRQPQGTMLGLFVSAGSLARMTFPVLSGYIVHYSNIGTLFALLVIMILGSISVATCNRRVLSLLAG